MKICKKCLQEKSLDKYSIRKDKRSGNRVLISYRNVCKLCMTKYNYNYHKAYYKKNKLRIDERNRQYGIRNKENIYKKKKIYVQKDEVKERIRQARLKNKKKRSDKNKVIYLNNKEKIDARNKQWQLNNKEKVRELRKQYEINNKEKILARKRIYNHKRRTTDIKFRIKSIISTAICNHLKANGYSKKGTSCLNYLPYSIQVLKDHLENLFESWMSWQNHGIYNSQTWNDNDPSTWTWNIDHIIPHSTFHYASMEDEAFKECWAISNLRPYSAKQNILDGNRRLF